MEKPRKGGNIESSKKIMGLPYQMQELKGGNKKGPLCRSCEGTTSGRL